MIQITKKQKRQLKKAWQKNKRTIFWIGMGILDLILVVLNILKCLDSEESK